MSATLFKLHSTDRFASCVIVAPTAGYTAGQMLKKNELVGVIVETKTAGQNAVLVYKADKIYVPKAAEAFAVGAKVYFDVADEEVNSSSSGNTLCGRVIEAAESGDAGVMIQLEGAVAA